MAPARSTARFIRFEGLLKYFYLIQALLSVIAVRLVHYILQVEKIISYNTGNDQRVILTSFPLSVGGAKIVVPTFENHGPRSEVMSPSGHS